MALSSGVIGSSGQIDLAERRAALLRRRRRVRIREWLGLLCMSGVALWMASAALLALMAR